MVLGNSSVEGEFKYVNRETINLYDIDWNRRYNFWKSAIVKELVNWVEIQIEIRVLNKKEVQKNLHITLIPS